MSAVAGVTGVRGLGVTVTAVRVIRLFRHGHPQKTFCKSVLEKIVDSHATVRR